MGKLYEVGRKLTEKAVDIRNLLHEQSKELFLDVKIVCPGIILPAHRYVLSSRSNVLAEQLLTSGANELNWTHYEDSACTALLRWIYTDEFASSDNLPATLDLLRASHHYQLVSLFKTCESSLLPSVNQETAQRVYGVAREVGANGLMDKCLTEFGPCFLLCSPEKLQPKADEPIPFDIAAMEVLGGLEFAKLVKDIPETMKTLRKLVAGWLEYAKLADIIISDGDKIWYGHAHFLGCRSEKIRDEMSISAMGHRRLCFTGLRGSGDHILLRWLYTDYVELNDVGNTFKLLRAARYYELLTLLDRCEDALVKTITITQCTEAHKIATEVNAMTVLRHCKQLISSYRIGLQSPGAPDDMEVDVEEDSDDSLCGMADCEHSSETATELLTLNDDCLFHIFRYLPLVDLGSIKDTCKRLNQLADQSFKIYRQKSIEITSCSMFGDILNLKHFGKQIKSLDFYDFYGAFASYADIFKMIVKFTSDQLTSISLDFDSNEEYTYETLKLLENVLKRVEVVKLHWLDESEKVNLLLGYCRNLKEVDLAGDEMDIQTLWCTNNSNIKSVSLVGGFVILHEICEKLPNLESLSIDDTSINHPADKMINLGRLKHLKRLKINAYRMNIGGTLQSLSSENALKYLCLCSADISDTLVQALDKLQHLKELTFEDCVKVDYYEQRILSKTLANVEKLAFLHCQTITFDEITRIVENLLNLKQLSILSCPEIDCIDKQNYLRLSRERNLEIFVDDTTYALSIKSIGEDLSNYVRLTAKPST